MTEPTSTDDDQRPNAAGAVHLSRRRFLTAAAVGVGAVGLTRFGLAHAEGRAAQFTEPGQALQPARRIPPPTTTTPPTTVPEYEPPAEGELLFPIIVGPDDDCFVADNFGDCRGSGCSRSHEGVDIMADRSLPIRSPAAGRLTKRYVDSGLTYGAGHGWTLEDEENGITYKFFHMDRHEEGLEVDDEIEMGQIIGYVGNTGTNGVCTESSPDTCVPRNYHLHFEYRPGNVAMDAFHLLQRAEYVDFE